MKDKIKEKKLMCCEICGEESVFADGICYNDKCSAYRQEVLYSN